MNPEECITQRVFEALKEWLVTAVQPAVFGTTTTPEANIEAVLASTNKWLEIHRKKVTAGLWAVILHSSSNQLDDRRVDISTEDQTSLGEALGDLPNVDYDEVLSTATALGASAATAALVLQLPTWRDVVTEYITRAENLVGGMPESVYRDMVGDLAEAQLSGEGIFDRTSIARASLNISNEGGYERWMVRARRIARTETNNAMNLGTFEAAKIEQSITGEKLDKVWVATMDGRTRDSHFRADGQRVPLEGKFLIGDYECAHPGDQSLPAHESINCRCTTIYLSPGEPLPGEKDRQTERERSDGSVHDPRQEVEQRATRGVTRDRDNNEPTIIAAAEIGETVMRRNWSGVLAPIGMKTGDGRAIAPDAEITSRTLPLPLLWQKTTSGGHDTSIIVGKISDVVIDTDAIRATGVMFDSPEAQEATSLLEDGVIRPSVDLVDVEALYVYEDSEGNEVDLETALDEGLEVKEIMTFTAAKLAGATLVSTPAFEGTFIELGDQEQQEEEDEDEDEALVASAAVTDLPNIDWFKDPRLDSPTALTVTSEGRVYGHLALWGTEHIGQRGVTPPHSKTGYALFHVSTLATNQGDVSVGRLTVGCGHADTNVGMRQASHHYDQVGTAWAYVKAGEDKHGIWVAGCVNPTADSEAVTAGASAPLSGDWRRVGGNLELVAALSVNVPGFPVPRSYSASGEKVATLVAAGVPTHRDTAARFRKMVEDSVDSYLAAKQRQDTARALAARVLAMKVNR